MEVLKIRNARPQKEHEPDKSYYCYQVSISPVHIFLCNSPKFRRRKDRSSDAKAGRAHDGQTNGPIFGQGFARRGHSKGKVRRMSRFEQESLVKPNPKFVRNADSFPPRL